MTFSSFIQEYWIYLTIPVVSGVVGYGTNWLAVKMMMSPVEFWGWGPIGWQGVIPANARKMAQVLVKHSVNKVLSQQELIDRIDPELLIEAMSHRLDPFVEVVVNEVMAGTSHYGVPVNKTLWAVAPIQVKQRVYDEVRSQLPKLLLHAIEGLKENMDELADMNDVIVEKLGSNKLMVIDIFRTAAHKEFKFIERSGLYFGLPLGLPVMVLWYFFPSWWILPLFGLLVGYITNALAMYLVQKPLEPVKVGPFVIQGLFIKRQKAVARYFGKVFANDLITAEVLINETLKKESSVEIIRTLIQREANHALETTQGVFKPVTVMSMGPEEYAKISEIISERAFSELSRPDKRTYEYLNKALDIEETIADRVGNLPPAEFYQLLHPIFAEDEWKLVAVGALLGLGAGFWQWALLT